MSRHKTYDWKRTGILCLGLLGGVTPLIGCVGGRPGTERLSTWSAAIQPPAQPSSAASGSVSPTSANQTGSVATRIAFSDGAQPDLRPHEPPLSTYDPPAYATVQSSASEAYSAPVSMVSTERTPPMVHADVPKLSTLGVDIARSEQRPTRKPERTGVIHASEATFEEQVLRSDMPVLVDFYASWCGPCKKLAPTLEEVAAETPQARVIKVNIDDSPGLAARYGVRSVPSLLVFKGGQVVASQTGVASKARLKAILDL